MVSNLDDECEEIFESLKTSMEIFYDMFNKYMNTDKSENSTYEKNLTTIIVRLESKFKEIYQTFSKINCKNNKHKNYPNDILTLNNTYKRLVNMFEKKKDEKIVNIKKEEADKSNQNEYIIQKEENLKINEEYCSQLQLDIETEKQKEYHGEKEKMEQIINIKNQIAQLTNTIQKQSFNSAQTILEIEQNVIETEKNIDKTNENLRQAALYKNKSNTIKYPIALGTIFGAAGTIVPGIGNVIGATLGTTIGYAVAKLEKKAINKIEPEKSKVLPKK